MIGPLSLTTSSKKVGGVAALLCIPSTLGWLGSIKVQWKGPFFNMSTSTLLLPKSCFSTACIQEPFQSCMLQWFVYDYMMMKDEMKSKGNETDGKDKWMHACY